MLVVHTSVLQVVEGFPESAKDVMSEEAVLAGIVSLIVDGVHNDKVALRSCVLEERPIKEGWLGNEIWYLLSSCHVDSEVLNLEVVAVVVQEAHQQTRWSQGWVLLEIPLVHVGHEQEHGRIRR